MAAKKRSSGKKVAIEIDVNTLKALAEAARSLSTLAGAFETAIGDKDARTAYLKTGKKAGKARR